MGISQRLSRIEQAAQQDADRALQYVVRVYGLSVADLQWARETKNAIEATFEGDWLDVVDQVLYDGGLVMCETDTGWIARLREPGQTDDTI